jgi:hypothetical protein
MKDGFHNCKNSSYHTNYEPIAKDLGSVSFDSWIPASDPQHYNKKIQVPGCLLLVFPDLAVHISGVVATSCNKINHDFSYTTYCIKIGLNCE